MENSWFLESEYPQTPQQEARFHIISVPMEMTVSYGGGTANGPDAIIAASAQLERLVEGLGEPGTLGIHTHQPIDCSADRTPEQIFAETANVIGDIRSIQGIPILLGGEHSITNGAVQYLVDSNLNSSVGIIQFDAHMDLRDSYEGSIHSHACVMRRAVEHGIRLHQVGIRNFSTEEVHARDRFGVTHCDASFLYQRRRDGEMIGTLSLPEDFPEQLYITFDVDAFDASLMGATGTPEPGGLFWWEALDLLEVLTRERTVIGADVVELAPVKTLHHCDYTAAKLTYHLMALIAQRNRYLHGHTSS